MAEKNGSVKSRNRLVIVHILSAVLTIAALALCFFLYQQSLPLKEENETLLKELEAREAALAETDAKMDEISDTLAYYTGMKDNLESTKKEYFDIISDLEQKILNGESDVKIAYLTFDDGPYYLSTKFLDVLDEYDVPATFFYLMKCAETGFEDQDADYDAIYRRIIASGHTLGNHTSIHKFGPTGVYSSVDAFKKSVIDNKNFIYERYGYTTNVFRFPGGSDTARSKSYVQDMIDYLVSEGYGYVDWNAATGDGGKVVLSAAEYRDNVLTATGGKNILVVLMHDYSNNTLACLPEIIEGLDRQGYIFLPMFNGSVMCKKQ
ncbi:MAG: polysaccharide deacetylase family protein [Erysipelotrichaceae bacterium]|nr:polysaccharide deacetylase family protein [Erysipelotrichaceae bacterium]